MLPAGRTVQLSLESPDVIHAFYVPQFLFKRDVVPGRINRFEFTVDEQYAGQTFRGQCAELCGAGHRLMLFEVHAYTPADFDAWLEQKIAEAERRARRPPPSGAPVGRSPPSGAPAGPALAVTALNIAFNPTDAAGPRGHAVQDRLRQPGPERPAQRRDPRRQPDRTRGLEGRDLPGAGEEDL